MVGTPSAGWSEEERYLPRPDLGSPNATHTAAPCFASLILSVLGLKYENNQIALFTTQKTFTEHLSAYRFKLQCFPTPQASEAYISESAEEATVSRKSITSMT